MIGMTRKSRRRKADERRNSVKKSPFFFSPWPVSDGLTTFKTFCYDYHRLKNPIRWEKPCQGTTAYDEKGVFPRKRSDKTARQWSHRREPIQCKPGSLMPYDSTTIQRLEDLGGSPNRGRQSDSES
jgi:hypothetical protein